MADRKNRHRPEFVAGLILTVCVIAAYGQVPAFDFINFDDYSYIADNPYLSAGITRESITWSFSLTDIAYWHPLTWLSHLLDFQLFGLNPGMHHVTNLFLHTANTLLLFFTLRWMTGAFWQSVFIAGLFGLHPLNVESVAWIAGRKNLLSTLFWMLTLLTYTRYAKHPNVVRYIFVLAVFSLGLMAKPMLVTLPFVLLLLDYWPLDRVQMFPAVDNFSLEIEKNMHSGVKKAFIVRLVLEKIPFFVLSAVSIFLSLSSVKQVVPYHLTPAGLRIANALVSYTGYIKKMIWPQKLAVFYPFPEALPRWQVAGAGLFLVGVSYLIVRQAKLRPYLVVGWLWYLGTLVPVIGLLQWGLWPAMADRFVYVPLIGIFIMVVWGLADVLSGFQFNRTAPAISAGIVFTALLTCTWFQVSHWQNTTTLFTHTLNVTRNNSVAHYVLGLSLEQKGNLDEAMIHYSRSLMLKPDYKTFFRKGYVLYQKGKLDEAMVNYSKSLQMNPNYAETHNNMGIVLARLGNVSGAINHYHASLKINPNYAGAYYNLGQLFDNQEKTGQAVYYYRKALMIEPDMARALYRRSWIAATHENTKYRDGVKAVELAEKLCKLSDYNEPVALDTLAAAYAEAGRFDQAVKTGRRGLDMALKSGSQDLAMNISKRLKLYQAGKPYRM